MSGAGGRLAAVTSTRADFGLLRWILQALAEHDQIQLQLIVTGTHLAREHGQTVDEVRASGLPIAAEVQILDAADSPLGTARAMGRAVAGIAEALERLEPDGLVLLGDRFEIFGAGAAATALGIPIAHLCGGESTSGALDDVWRDGLTVMASLHLVAAEPYAAAVRGLGADPSSVHVVGSPGLEAARLLERSSLAALGESVGLELERPLMLLAFHPATAPGPDEPSSGEQLDALEAALGERPGTLIATFANADAGGRAVNERLQAMARERPNTIAVPSLGSERYLQALALADVLVGNSSSGLIEAPAFELPVVNIGSRQGGRLRAANVIDAEPTRQAIGEALDRALDANFRADLAGLENPYGDGHTSGRVVALLEHELETWAR